MGQSEDYIAQYRFELPEELIARYPANVRDESRLLVLNRKEEHLEDRLFRDLPSLLSENDLLVRNVSRVSPRRVLLQRESGAVMETLFLEKTETPSRYTALIKNRKKLRAGEKLHLYGNNSEVAPVFEFEGGEGMETASLLRATTKKTGEDAWKNPEDAELFFQRFGQMPIPPYLKRSADELDRERYQTIYADKPGSAAAPTAGLHFTKELMERLKANGVEILDVDLQVGYGTFAPLKEENFQNGSLHTEPYSIPPKTAQILNEALNNHRRILSVGTTTLRALESNFRMNHGSFSSGNFSTNLFIHPPDRIQSIHGLITNFHLPESSLLMLVASLTGRESLLRVYDHAVQNRYRFFSYGDAMLII